MGRIITGHLDGIPELVHSLAEQGELPQGQLAFLLRLSSHIMLVLRELEIAHNQDIANILVSEYLHALMHYHVVHPPTNASHK
jgi:hypothetical protein